MSTSCPTWLVRSPEDLGRAVAGVRHTRGLTQQQLSELADVERTYLSRLEAGATAILLERALRCLRRMGAEVTVTLPSDFHDGAKD